jgi:hypothetical protein
MNKITFFVKKAIKMLNFIVSSNFDFREFHQFPFDYNKPLCHSAHEEMSLCCRVLESLKINYRLTDGTILGIYRQGHFIPHDSDIDVDILDYENDFEVIHEKMTQAGMRLGRKVFYKKKLQQVVYYSGNKVVFDMVFWYSKGEKIYNYSERLYERCQEKYFFEDLPCLEFQGKRYPIPSQIEKWLEMRFGTDWRIPKTYKGDWKDECGDLKKVL